MLYKRISNVITKGLQSVGNSLIDNGQAAFVPRRIIIDNVLLNHELVKGYDRNGISPRCMLKIDMQKVYDSVEWSFLEQMLVPLDFPICFVNWIMNCVRTVSYSVMIRSIF